MQIRRRYKWVNRFPVRKKDGRVYWYTKLRLPGRPSINLPDINAPEFDAAYEAAVRGEPLVQDKPMRCGPGSVNDLVAKYLASNPFKSENTAARRKSTLKQFCAAKGNRPMASMTTKFLQASLDAMEPHPAKTFLLAIRPVLDFAKARGIIQQNPADGLKVEVTSTPHHPWTVEEIEQYRAHHAYGTMARVAIELEMCQGLRRGDAIRLGPQHTRRDAHGQYAEIASGKTKITTYNPITAELQQALQACEVRGHSTFLVRTDGRPYDERSFNKDFRRWIDAAGLPKKCKPHGLRAAFATLLAEAGRSDSEIAAAGGWEGWQMPRHYTQKARRKLQARAMAAAKSLSEVAS